MSSDSHYPRSQLACQRRHPTHHSQLTSVLQPTNLLLSVSCSQYGASPRNSGVFYSIYSHESFVHNPQDRLTVHFRSRVVLQSPHTPSIITRLSYTALPHLPLDRSNTTDRPTDRATRRSTVPNEPRKRGPAPRLPLTLSNADQPTHHYPNHQYPYRIIQHNIYTSLASPLPFDNGCRGICACSLVVMQMIFLLGMRRYVPPD